MARHWDGAQGAFYRGDAPGPDPDRLAELGYASAMTRSLRVARACALLLMLAACTAPPGASAPPSQGTASASPSTAGGDCSTTAPPQGTPEGWDVGSQRPSLFPQVINPAGTIACGPTRLMFSFLDDQNVPVATPDRTVDVRMFDLGADPSTAVVEGSATFIWAIEPRVGVYVIDVDLPTAGTYGLEFTTAPAGAEPEVIRTVVDVHGASAVTAVGDKAPPSDTPTLDDVGGDVARLSTDPDPVPAFYQTSIADAVAAKEPFVVAFATPKFCVSQQCGPTLDRLKPIVASHPGLTVINVEPYELQTVDGQLQPVLTNDKLTPTTATSEWRLPTEPWVFVVDRNGIVTASFMLIFSDEELEAAISAVE